MFKLVSTMAIMVYCAVYIILNRSVAFANTLLDLGFLKIAGSNANVVRVFRCSSTGLVCLVSVVFAVVCAIQVCSCLRGGHGTSLCNSLPVNESALFIAGATSTCLVSVVPALFFLKIVSVVAIYAKGSMVDRLDSVFLGVYLKALTSVSFFNLVTVYYKAVLGSILVFVTIYMTCPLSTVFVGNVIINYFSNFCINVFGSDVVVGTLGPLTTCSKVGVVC